MLIFLNIKPIKHTTSYIQHIQHIQNNKSAKLMTKFC